MSGGVLILRPEPGASATADRARTLGLQPVLAPLFAVSACDWEAPDPAGFDAVLLTSANAVRLAGPALAHYLGLPCYAVGDATAAAARQAGFTDISSGSGDGAVILAKARRDEAERLLHLCGRDHIALDDSGVARRIIYAAEPVAALPTRARTALAEGMPALLHSPRAASLFAGLVDAAGIRRASVAIVAISAAAAAAAGEGWKSVSVAAHPRDEAVLELAAKLCNIVASS